MKKLFPLSLILFGALLFASCNKSGNVSKEQAEKIAVSWKLVSNFIEPEGRFKAQFTIRNGSDFTLNGKNWKLFWNMSPRPIQSNKTPEPATIEHINGDWYQMVPAKDFIMRPRDSMTITYTGTEGVIKETDAPLGLYFVFYDDEGKEKDIVQVADYTIEPFTTKEQILRGKMDLKEVPTAETRYKANAGFTKLSEEQLLKIIPSPVKLVPGAGTFTLTGKTNVFYQEGLESEAKYLISKLKTLTGTDLPIQAGLPSKGSSEEAAIVLKTGKVTMNGVASEAYNLNIGQMGITIEGSDAAGVFYGVQSLLQLAPTDAYQKPIASIGFGFVQVQDAPRFQFRSLHLDVARNFQTKESVKRIIDLLSGYKVNHLLLYTTEDEGWRIEIDGLPELTQVGAQRQHTSGMNANALHPGYGSGPVANEKGKHGSGYYTKTDFIEILKYAHERHIKIIPELNFPGHALAAIKSMEARYERLMKEGKEKEANEYRLIDPDDKSIYISAQGYKNNVVSPARESTYNFFVKVVDEIAKLYEQAGLKMDTFHTGGDEVADGVWTKSPMAAKLLQEHPEVKGPRYLQTYFFRKLLPMLEKRGLKVHGWEEVALNKTETGAYLANPEFVGRQVYPYVWNNVYDVDLGNRLANAGYPVVLCNVTNFYFDMSYNNDPKEPGLYWGGFVDTRDNWAFAPFNMFRTTEETAMGKPMKQEFVGKQLMKPEARKNVYGVEAQLWSETIKGRDMMEYSILPKLLGFSESAWAAERKWENVADDAARKAMMAEGWNIFANSIAQKHLPRLKYINGGYNYRLPQPGAIIENGMLKANVELPGLAIRYTTDGSEPTETSQLYENPVKVSGTVTLKKLRSGRTIKPQQRSHNPLTELDRLTTRLSLNPSPSMNIGVDIGGTNIRAGIESGGHITRQNQTLLANKHSLSATLDQLMDVIRPLTAYPVKGIGIGVPSVVDVNKGIVYNVMNIPSWEEVALRDIVEKEFNLPVSVNNDVNCFVLGEHRFGLAKRFQSVIGMAIGTGLGSGIIIDNHLYAGKNCGAGEIGMLPYKDSILENYVCSRFFEDSLGIDAFAAHEAALKGSKKAIEVWEEFGVHLGAVIKAIMYTYDPEAIVMGGSIAKANRFFQESMLESIQDFAYPESLKKLTLLLSENDNIALLGAAALLGD